MKRVIACLLAVILLCSLLPSVFAAEEPTSYSAAMLLMKDLGVVYGYEDGTLRPENNITRMEFVTMALRLMGYYNLDDSYAVNSAFSDVKPDLWGAKNIGFACQIGIIDGHGEGIFAPEEQVTVNQVLKVLVCILGYKSAAEELGYPTGYLKVATQLSLIGNVSVGEISATRDNVAQLMANALDAVLMEEIYHSDGTENYVKTNKTLLDAMGIEKRIGFVYAVPGITIESETELQENQAMIGDVVYDAKFDISEYIGSEVLIWVDVSEKLPRPQILHVEKMDSDREITVRSRDISSASSRSALVWYDDSGRQKTTELKSGAPVIYNGKILTTAEESNDRFKPKTGYVTVKNLSNDNQVIMIWNFENYVVQSVSNEKIYDLFGNKLDLSDDSLAVSLTLDGNEITLEDLKAGDILSAAVSLDREYYKIMVSRRKISGDLVKETKKEEETIYEVLGGDEVYSLYLAKNYKEYLANNSTKVSELYPGDSAVFSLDYFGDIAYTSQADQSSEIKYGYIADASYENSGLGSGMLHLKIMDESNHFEIYTVTDSDSLKYGMMKNGDYIIQSKAFEDFQKQVITQDGVVRQLIKYKTDANGIIREIYLLDTKGISDIWGNSVSETSSYSYYNGIIDSRYLVDGNTIAFYIPNAGNEVELFKSGRAVTLMSSAAYNVQLYDIVDNRVGVVLIKTQIPGNNGYQFMIDMVNNPVMLVEEVGTTMDGDEIVHYVSGWQDGSQVSVSVADHLEENSDDFSTLQPGMLIQYLMNTEERSRAETAEESEKMILFRTIENFNHIPSQYQKWNYLETVNSNAKIRVISGIVSVYDLPNLVVNCGSSAAVSIDDSVNVIRWNQQTKTGEKATIQDIMLNEPVFVRTRYNVTKDIYIFE